MEIASEVLSNSPKGVENLPRQKREPSPLPPRRSRPATTPEGRENQLIAMAHDLAEQRLLDGTASAQEVTHFLKLGSSRERLEQERLYHENELLKVKKESLESQARIEEMYKNAIGAMRAYSGQEPLDPSDEFGV